MYSLEVTIKLVLKTSVKERHDERLLSQSILKIRGGKHEAEEEEEKDDSWGRPLGREDDKHTNVLPFKWHQCRRVKMKLSLHLSSLPHQNMSRERHKK